MPEGDELDEDEENVEKNYTQNKKDVWDFTEELRRNIQMSLARNAGRNIYFQQTDKRRAFSLELVI